MQNVQGGSNMTGTDCGLFTHKSVPVIFEPPCITNNILAKGMLLSVQDQKIISLGIPS